MEKTAYLLLAVVAIIVALAIVASLLLALPYSILVILVLVAIGLLFYKVLRERLTSKEDDHYSKNVDR